MLSWEKFAKIARTVPSASV